MNKIIIFAAAAAALAAYLIRRRSLQAQPAPMVNNPGKTQKHLTNVFARAKRQSQLDE